MVPSAACSRRCASRQRAGTKPKRRCQIGYTTPRVHIRPSGKPRLAAQWVDSLPGDHAQTGPVHCLFVCAASRSGSCTRPVSHPAITLAGVRACIPNRYVISCFSSRKHKRPIWEAVRPLGGQEQRSGVGHSPAPQTFQPKTAERACQQGQVAKTWLSLGAFGASAIAAAQGPASASCPAPPHRSSCARGTFGGATLPTRLPRSFGSRCGCILQKVACQMVRVQCTPPPPPLQQHPEPGPELSTCVQLTRASTATADTGSIVLADDGHAHPVNSYMSSTMSQLSHFFKKMGRTGPYNDSTQARAN